MRRSLVTGFVISALLFGSVAVSAPVGAAGTTGSWPTWTITPDDTTAADHSGTIAFGLQGMPDATYTVSKDSVDDEDTEILPNDDEYIAADTPFGQVFGASGPSTDTQFLKTRIDTNIIEDATVVVTFAEPVPAGILGFAVSDVDIDQVAISGTQSGGAPLTGAELAGEAFNLCDTTATIVNCEGVSAPFPVPTWDPTTSTVVGSGDDTDGEAAWFQPTVAVASLTFVFSGQDGAGAPSFRLWLAALGSTVSGAVTSTCTSATQPATLTLTGPDGTVLQTVTAAADGTYAFDPAAAVNGYQVAITAPEGCTVEGTNPVGVDLSAGDATANFALVGAPAPAPAPAPATPAFTG